MAVLRHRSAARLFEAALSASVGLYMAPAAQAQSFNGPPQFQNATDIEAPNAGDFGYYVWARDPDGQTVTYATEGVPQFSLVRQVLMGDIDEDGAVTLQDVATVESHIEQDDGRLRPNFPHPNCLDVYGLDVYARASNPYLDLNNDGSVDRIDAELIQSLIGTEQWALFFDLHEPVAGTYPMSVTATDPYGAVSTSSTRIVILDLSVFRTYRNHDDVLVVVNDNSPISVEIAGYFVRARHIPKNHIVHIAAPAEETISFQAFSDSIRVPIEEFLTSTGVLDEINYVVTTKGVPLRISGSFFSRASVDSELTLILGPYADRIDSRDGAVLSPIVHSDFPFSRKTHGVFLVTRLTGYTYTDVVRLIDNAALALDRGPKADRMGRFVFDVDPTKDGSALRTGNLWLRRAAATTSAAGYDTLLDEMDRFVNDESGVLGYASWGSNDANDTNHAIPGFGWMPGALAETFVSTSARSFTTPPVYGQSLIADLIAEGVTGAKGYVFEPLLSAIAHPDILFDRYLRGFNLADSYYMSSSFMSWMDVVVGDPKTRIRDEIADPGFPGTTRSCERSPSHHPSGNRAHGPSRSFDTDALQTLSPVHPEPDLTWPDAALPDTPGDEDPPVTSQDVPRKPQAMPTSDHDGVHD